jgi:hypothetical protein
MSFTELFLFRVVACLDSLLHLLLAFAFSEHLHDLLLGEGLHLARKTQNVCGLVGLLGFLYLQLAGQLIF